MIMNDLRKLCYGSKSNRTLDMFVGKYGINKPNISFFCTYDPLCYEFLILEPNLCYLEKPFLTKFLCPD